MRNLSTPRRCRAGGATLISTALILGCGTDGTVDPPLPALCASVNAVGQPGLFDVGTWNIEWFGDRSRGPVDETLQKACFRSVIAGSQIDLWGVQEIVDGAAFEAILDSLPGVDGLLADHPSIVNGPAIYDGDDQKLGVIWDPAALRIDSGRIVLPHLLYEFAGRPPLELFGDVLLGAGVRPIVILVLHAKAGVEQEDHARRTDAALALQQYLDSARATDDVLILGDFNDQLDQSIRAGAQTPYQGFVQAPTEWRFVTDSLGISGQTSTVYFNSVIDHVLASNEMAARFVSGSALVMRLDSVITDYGVTVSDHYPIIARFVN